MSLFLVTTAWVSGADLERVPTVVYAINLLLAAIAYWILELAISRLPGEGHRCGEAVSSDRKEWLSIALYLFGISLAAWMPWVDAVASRHLFAAVAVMWLMPDDGSSATSPPTPTTRPVGTERHFWPERFRS